MHTCPQAMHHIPDGTPDVESQHDTAAKNLWNFILNLCSYRVSVQPSDYNLMNLYLLLPLVAFTL